MIILVVLGTCEQSQPQYMSVNWQFFGKICIRVTPADQFNNRIWGWVYWGLFLGRSVRWKNWGKIVCCEGEMRGQWEPMLAGAAGDATKYRPEYSRHQIRKSSSSISMKADQILSWKVKLRIRIFSLLPEILDSLTESLFGFLLASYLPVLNEVVGIILFLCPIGLGLSKLTVPGWTRSRLRPSVWHKWYLVLRPDP